MLFVGATKQDKVSKGTGDEAGSQEMWCHYKESFCKRVGVSMIHRQGLLHYVDSAQSTLLSAAIFEAL